MSVFKKIIPFVGIFAMLFLPVSSAQAAGVYTGSTSYWDQLLLGMVHGTSSIPLIGDAVQGIAGGLAGGVCSSSSDGLHHTSAISNDKVYEDSTGYFSFGTCAYCGDRFKVYGADLASAYETQVSELPATGVTSSGALIWEPYYSFSGAGSYGYSYSKFNNVAVGYVFSEEVPFVAPGLNGSSTEYMLDADQKAIVGTSTTSIFVSGYKITLSAPVSGS